jgi:hypothetical protein
MACQWKSFNYLYAWKNFYKTNISIYYYLDVICSAFLLNKPQGYFIFCGLFSKAVIRPVSD